MSSNKVGIDPLIAHGDSDDVVVAADMGSALHAERNTAINGVDIILAIDRGSESHHGGARIAVPPDLLIGSIEIQVVEETMAA